MEPQQPHYQRASHPLLQNFHFASTPQLPAGSANSTPVSSPGLFNPTNPRSTMSLQSEAQSAGTTPVATDNSPFLHPLQGHKVRETHKANVDTDFTTGRKLINHYEIIDELGRGVHGKVKLARNLETGENVAIKIIPRFSKKRRLGKVTAMSTQDKSKREIAILKKIRHPNVVGLIEIIDDPELKKIYMVLEHVELGEIVWRKKGVPSICGYERRRIEREMSGREPTPEEERYDRSLERRQALKDLKLARMIQTQINSRDFWSLEHGGIDEDDSISMSQPRSLPRDGRDASGSTAPNPESPFASRATSRAPSRNQSQMSLHSMRQQQISRSGTPQPSERDLLPIPNEDDMETPGPAYSLSDPYKALDGTMFGAYVDDSAFRARSPSMADSIVSHMSSVDYRVHDPFADDFSYVPCFTIDKARQTFRDTVLGLEYLHYEGIIHRDIKPANLLWTRDQRVKISDFGVSYFGRPIRDGEPDETISESEARDFDNDLELAKTVGTPAFFAPELCYTEFFDSDGRPRPQPKVTEQIDVWSLGVTLYCLIFARIPFLGEDEWQMFRKIATEEVYIPRRRLVPVHPSTKPDEASLFTRVNPLPYRNDDELRYEDIDAELYDLLSKMLIKNPEKRIRLRDVKRHPWVIRGEENVMAWLDDTDPSRRTLGRKIQVDEKEMARAVVPISIIERARSAVKKTINKVMNHRAERGEGSSRRRAASSAASSAGESPALGTVTPNLRDMRRRSLRPDDYFVNAFHSQYSQQAPGEHPLTQSVTVSPGETPQDGEDALSATQQPLASVGGHSTRQFPDVPGDFNSSEDTDRRAPASTPRSRTRHTHASSITDAVLSRPPSLRGSLTVPPTPSFDDPLDDPSSTLRKARDTRSSPDDVSRARSVDRALFSSHDKRAEAKVSLSTAVAPGSVHLPPRLQSMRSVDVMRGLDSSPLPSPLGTSAPRSLIGYQHGHPKSDPNMHHRQRSATEPIEMPSSPEPRIRDLPDAKTPPPRVYNSSTPESFARAQENMIRRQLRDHEEQVRRQQATTAEEEVDPAFVPCPASPTEEILMSQSPLPMSRQETIATAVSSSSTSISAMTTPITNPSEMTSPICLSNSIAGNEMAGQILTFQSDPSLPALLSGASSVSADPEGEFLNSPGVVNRSSVIDTTDSLTPPALTKEPVAGFPLEEQMRQEQEEHDALAVELLDDRASRLRISASNSATAYHRHHKDEEDDSDSDEGLTMMRRSSKKGRHVKHGSLNGKTTVFGARRRDTNVSIASTDTAKKVIVDSE